MNDNDFEYIRQWNKKEKYSLVSNEIMNDDHLKSRKRFRKWSFKEDFLMSRIHDTINEDTSPHIFESSENRKRFKSIKIVEIYSIIQIRLSDFR